MMVFSFSSGKTPKLSEVGSKGKYLIECANAGFKIPDGFVLSVEFFRNWLEQIKNTKEWKEFLLNSTREACDLLKLKAKECKFSSEQRKIIAKEINKLKGNFGYAVRSSSPEEDLKNASFAGQYETTLGVTKNNLELAIIDTFASIFDSRVLEYKKLNNITINNPRIAVIVQKQINSEISGIAFSLNPKNNAYDEVLINASFGLGETIVSGQVTPDSYVVDKIKKQIIEKHIHDKKISLCLQDNGRTIKKLNSYRQNQALNDEQILLVSQLTQECEKYYKIPIDIEWAIEKNVIYLLQARPITTFIDIYPEMRTAPSEPKKLYIDLIVLSQGFSEPFSVMGIEIWQKLLNCAKKRSMPEGKDGIILNIHGKQYINMSNYFKGLGKNLTQKFIGNYEVPVRKIISTLDFKNEYRSVKFSKEVKYMKLYIPILLLGMIVPVIKGYLNHDKAKKNYEKISREVFNYCKNDLIKEKPFAEIIEDGMRVFAKLAKTFMLVYPGFISFEQLKKMFKDQEAKDLVNNLGMDLPTNPTSKMGHHMLRLASYADIKATTTKEEFSEKVKNKKYPKEFLEDYFDYLDKYGSRGFKEIDIATPRLSYDPQQFFMQLKALNIENNNILDIKDRKQEAYNKLLIIAKRMNKERKFIKLAKLYNDLFGYREDPKYLFVVMVGELRKRAIEIGERFVKENRLKFPEQIFNLTIKQVTQAESDLKMDLQTIIEKNISPRKLMKNIKDWPKIIDSRGKIFKYVKETDAGDLIGEPISPGIFRGKAKVLKSPYEKKLKSGEILVIRAAEPSWTPIFINASAVVMEIGGPLQHGSIIAREYGIPCVSGIEDAVNILKDGDILEVDGSIGLVKILK